MAPATEEEKMGKGEYYYAFSPDLVKQRNRCAEACNRMNNATNLSRRQMVELWRQIQHDDTPMPPELEDPDADAAQFAEDPWITPPVRMDYGTNVKLGKNAYFNFGCTFIDVRVIAIGARALVGPNVSFYTASHPLDPVLRNGTNGPEYGKEIHIGDDCWLGGNVIILPGVTLGYGVVVGAGSVVTKDVPDLHVVAGNPARIIKKIPPPKQSHSDVDSRSGAEKPMAELAQDLETKSLNPQE